MKTPGLVKKELSENAKILLNIKKAESTEQSAGSFEPPLQHPYKPQVLEDTVTENSILGQCVEAYMTNIDSTGFDIIPIDPDKVDLKVQQAAGDFFNEPHPGFDMSSMRRKLRKDIETYGYGAFGVIRANSGEILMLKHLKSKYLAIGSKDGVTDSVATLTRNGKEVEVIYKKRYRSYAYTESKVTEFYREFGAPDSLDRLTGRWKNSSTSDPAQEIIFFDQALFTKKGYPVPRWINQSKAIVGMDKAELLNAEYLFNDGIPPAIVFLLNGEAQKVDGVSSMIDASQSNRISVVEVSDATGSLDSTSKVGIQVERFGAEMLKDSMYGNYIEKSRRGIREAFRLPSLFLGDGQDHTYNNALVSYKTTENQVFKPERMMFDNIINSTIMKSQFPGYKFESKPLVLSDMEASIKGLELVKDNDELEDGTFVDNVNRVTGLKLMSGANQQGKANQTKSQSISIDDIIIKYIGEGSDSETDCECLNIGD